MTRSTFAGTLRLVRRETKIITMKASGTVQAAGWRSRSIHISSSRGKNAPIIRASPQEMPPASRPAMAPRAVSERHQMPSSSSGQIVDAVKAKTLPMAPANASELVTTATKTGSAVASTVEILKPRTVPEKNSWESAPARETTSPEVVERKRGKGATDHDGGQGITQETVEEPCGKSKIVASVSLVAPSSGV